VSPRMPDPPPPPPPQAYQASPAPASGSVVRLPAGLTLWDLIGLVIILLGAILILAGFLEGNAWASCTAPGCSASTAQGDIQGFFSWTGTGIFLVVLGWLLRAMIFPMIAARKRSSPTGMGAPAPEPAPMMAPPAPPAAAPGPATPVCPKCGKPTTYIAQYGRYYCYTDATYV
jgi:hypothetical protein